METSELKNLLSELKEINTRLKETNTHLVNLTKLSAQAAMTDKFRMNETEYQLKELNKSLKIFIGSIASIAIIKKDKTENEGIK